MGFIRAFMLTIGPISSLFDFLTFFLLWHLFGTDATLFRTGWFVESMATQVLVIFVIRTRRNPLHSRPATGLLLSSGVAVLLALLLPLSPLAPYLGFAPLPPLYFGLLLVLVSAYLLMVEGGKRWFYRHRVKA
jgi:Mg2+-importing ATPase